ncbi:uncharacterized protein LOC107047549 [Diachasma alloeum]|uniref:uncharacterized protein LOC107047549 n=1 Tax=Diachasma alloeum TaxID=454923 RepID=UPI0007383A4A|nr:uncharacterized protein LOC107047549 [Diachasma alloeum]
MNHESDDILLSRYPLVSLSNVRDACTSQSVPQTSQRILDKCSMDHSSTLSSRYDSFGSTRNDNDAGKKLNKFNLGKKSTLQSTNIERYSNRATATATEISRFHNTTNASFMNGESEDSCPENDLNGEPQSPSPTYITIHELEPEFEPFIVDYNDNNDPVNSEVKDGEAADPIIDDTSGKNNKNQGICSLGAELTESDKIKDNAAENSNPLPHADRDYELKMK